MKLNLVILLLLAVALLNAKHHSVKRISRQEEEGSAEEGSDAEGGDAEGGLTEDVLIEYRILGKGTFGVHNGAETSDAEDDNVTLRGDMVHFPNYCKQQLSSHQFTSLTAKASTYLECWNAAAQVEELDSCNDLLAECIENLSAFEVDPTAEIEDEDEAAEGSEAEGDAEEGDDAEAEEEEPEAEGDDAEDEEGDNQCGEGDDEDDEDDEDDGDDEDDEDDDDEYESEEEIEELDYVDQDIPLLNENQVACYYSAVTRHLQTSSDSLTFSQALEESNAALIFKELTFQTKVPRTAVSWLEFWLYMCNENENILQIFDHNDVMIYSDEARELYEVLNEVSEDEEEDEEDGDDEEGDDEEEAPADERRRNIRKRLVRQH